MEAEVIYWNCQNENSRPFVELTPLGICADETIQTANRDSVKIDKYVIMPNHIHMIVILRQDTDDRGRSVPTTGCAEY